MLCDTLIQLLYGSESVTQNEQHVLYIVCYVDYDTDRDTGHHEQLVLQLVM